MSLNNFKDSKAIFSQTDPRWEKKKIGGTGLTLGDWGCTITAISRMFYRLFNVAIRPDKMTDMLKFDNGGRVYWSSVEAMGRKLEKPLTFKGRFSRPPSAMELREASYPKRFMLLELNQTPRHWVTLEANSILPFVSAMDPIPGKIVRKPKWKIIGFAKFEA